MSSASKAIVIGSGISGIATAIRLAVEGYQVTVFEKNSYPGGKLSQFNQGDFSYDAGPSLFTQPENIENLFKFSGEPIEAYFEYQSLPVSFKYFYEDGTEVNAYTDTEKFGKELEEKLGEEKGVLLKYLKQSSDLYQHVGRIFLNYSLHKFSTVRNAPIRKALSVVRFRHLFRSMHAFNHAYFKNPKTIQLFNRYATYNGSDPYKAPGMLTLIPHLEHNEGTYYPRGGMISITNALYQLALKKGVQFHFNTTVSHIIRHQHKVLGVVADKKNIYADIVISNMDVYFTYKNLLQDDRMAAKVLKQERSSSALIFYWNINRQFESLGLHNIFFTENYEKEFDALFTKFNLYDDPTVYINITSKCEPGIHAPAGKENWFVMVNVPANNGQNWVDLQAKCRSAVLSKLSRILKTDIGACIEEEAVLDPVIIESRTASYMGSLYGTSSNSRMAAFMRHPNFSSSIKGLYFSGGSVHPGGGIPLCLKSAEIVHQLIKNDYSKK